MLVLKKWSWDIDLENQSDGETTKISITAGRGTSFDRCAAYPERIANTHITRDASPLTPLRCLRSQEKRENLPQTTERRHHQFIIIKSDLQNATTASVGHPRRRLNGMFSFNLSHPIVFLVSIFLTSTFHHVFSAIVLSYVGLGSPGCEKCQS